jgi:hypothetical protein
MAGDDANVAARKREHDASKRAFLEAQAMFQEDPAMAAEMASAGRAYKAARVKVEEAVKTAINAGLKRERDKISKEQVRLRDLTRRRAELNRNIGLVKGGFSETESDKRKEKEKAKLAEKRKELKEKLDALNEIVPKEEEAKVRRQ